MWRDLHYHISKPRPICKNVFYCFVQIRNTRTWNIDFMSVIIFTFIYSFNIFLNKVQILIIEIQLIFDQFVRVNFMFDKESVNFTHSKRRSTRFHRSYTSVLIPFCSDLKRPERASYGRLNRAVNKCISQQYQSISNRIF